jgi:flavin-dependent dehydrogenase
MLMTIAATFSLTAATERCWDVIVIGAGPAGAVAAQQLALQRHAVLLVDQSSFPRWKVCGACLSGEAQTILASAGLGKCLSRLGAVPLTNMHLRVRGTAMDVPLRRRIALSRGALDAALIDAAVRAGASFLPETHGRLGAVTPRAREVLLRRDRCDTIATARIVIAADGLGGTACAGTRAVNTSVRVDSRLGAGTVVDDASSVYGRGTIYMACGTGGYVGLVRLEDGRLNMAGAFDTAAVRRHGGVTALAAATLAAAGMPAVPSMPTARWRGTPALTRHARRPAATRLFLAGDAAGYVEPFTGDGMAAALTTGMAVAKLAARGCRRWDPILEAQWASCFRGLVTRRHRACGWLAGLLRRPKLLAVGAAAVRRLPILLNPVLHFLEGSGGDNQVSRAFSNPDCGSEVPCTNGAAKAPDKLLVAR